MKSSGNRRDGRAAPERSVSQAHARIPKPKGEGSCRLGGAVSRHGVSGPPAAEVRVADNTTKWISGAHGVYRELSCLCEVMKTDGLKFVFNDGAVLTWRHDMT